MSHLLRPPQAAASPDRSARTSSRSSRPPRDEAADQQQEIITAQSSLLRIYVPPVGKVASRSNSGSKLAGSPGASPSASAPQSLHPTPTNQKRGDSGTFNFAEAGRVRRGHHRGASSPSFDQNNIYFAHDGSPPAQLHARHPTYLPPQRGTTAHVEPLVFEEDDESPAKAKSPTHASFGARNPKSWLPALAPRVSSLFDDTRNLWHDLGLFRRKRNQPMYTALLNRRTLGFLALVVFLVYACAFVFSCTSPLGCRAWPFGNRSPKPDVPFTIISLLRDMSEETLLKDKSQFVIQWNALISWTMVVPASQILIYMDTESSCNKIMSQPELLGMTCLVVPCWHPEHKRPLLDCIFRVAHETATTELIAFVNGDILLHSDTQQLVNHVAETFPDFLMVSRRTDTLVPQRVLDEFASKSSQEQVLELLSLSVTEGALHSEFGIDLFLYPKRLFDDLNFPPYLAGVYRWDNWLLSEMLVRENVAVVDATRQGLVVHQEMGKVGHQGRTGAPYNDAIVKARSGLKYRIGNIKNSDFQIEYEVAPGEPLPTDASNGLGFRLEVNHNASIEVLIAKRVNKDGWVAVLPVSHFDLHGHLSNWLCWADRINFTSFIFLAQDRVAARELQRRGLPVLQFDEALEESTEDATIHAGDGLSIGPHSKSGARTTAENFDFLMFRQEFLSIVLRTGFHFLYGHLNSIWLEDPLHYMAEGTRGPYGVKSFADQQAQKLKSQATDQDFDIMAPGNATYFDAHLIAVRSTQWGKYLWRQVGVCEEANGVVLFEQSLAALHPQANATHTKIVDCLNTVLLKFKSKVRRRPLPPQLFPDHEQYFVQQSTLVLGSMPIIIQDDMQMSLLGTMASTTVAADPVTSAEDPTVKVTSRVPSNVWGNNYAGRIRMYKANQIQRWKEWKLLSIHVPTVNVDGDNAELPPITHACLNLDPKPIASSNSIAAWDAYKADVEAGVTGGSSSSVLDFDFKIRVLTFDRPQSLARLLDSLNLVEFDPEDRGRITLEVSIDYPADLNDEESLRNWRLVQTICDAFKWKQGAYQIIHQQANIGLTGQWTWGWNEPNVAKREIILFLEDDTSLVPLSWRWMKNIIHNYYLNPHNYDPNLFGFSLQSQHTILGESKQFRYGSRSPSGIIPDDTFHYRYQLLGTWGTVFFPEHWLAFTAWLKSRSFQHSQGTSSRGFQPCVPGLLSNSWWMAKPKRVWSQWMVRFAFEKGWYSLYSNFRNKSSVVVNFREGGLNFAVAKGPMNPAIEELPTEYMNLPPLASLPLYDFNFRDYRSQPNHLKYHAAVMGASMPAPGGGAVANYWPAGSFHDDCYVMGNMKTVMKAKEDAAIALAAEVARLKATHVLALEQQRHISEQQDALFALKREINVASSEQQLASIKRKEAALKQARADADEQWRIDAEREKADLIESHKSKLARQKARREREALDREAALQLELSEEEELRKQEELERLVTDAKVLAVKKKENKRAHDDASSKDKKKKEVAAAAAKKAAETKKKASEAAKKKDKKKLR